MTPYLCSAIRCRDADLRGEYRNVGLLVMSPALRRAELRRGGLKQRAHLIGDDADFVRAMLKSLLEEAREVGSRPDRTASVPSPPPRRAGPPSRLRRTPRAG